MDAVSQPRDWFAAAVQTEGSVADALDAVVAELDGRRAFITALKERLSPAPGVDAVSTLSHQIKNLENTLRFRLGILRPERPGAWFRAPATTSAGPFASAVIEAPVFALYDPSEAETVSRELPRLWQARVAGPLPFKEMTPNLWATLLEINAAWAALVVLPSPFAMLNLAELPDSLPRALDSRALRAFLINVRTEVLATRARLDHCFSELQRASERFWTYQIEQERRYRGRHGSTERPRVNHTADSVREEFKRRRQSTSGAGVGGGQPPLSGVDRQAMRFMGFDDVPNAEALRQRYLSMAKRLHPDREGGNDTAFKMLSSAYSHLLARVESGER